jgi:hypothetical protein
MQPEHAVDGAHFGGPYEFRMRDGDCEERTLERLFGPGSKGVRGFEERYFMIE